MITWKLALALALAGCGPSGKDGPRGARDDGATRQIWLEDPYADSDGSCATPAESAALTRLNALRAAAGAAAVRCLEPLTRTARAHADYLAAHPDEAASTPHAERADQRGYTGTTPGARAAAAGLDFQKFWLAEGVGGNAAVDDVLAAARLVDLHVDTVYHRGPLLTPSAAYFALAPSGPAGPAVLMTLARVGTRAAAVAHPPDGATGVPAAFDARHESPEPPPRLGSRPGGGNLRGYPVSFHAQKRLAADTGKEQPLGLEAFVLRRLDTGVAVTGLILDARRVPHLAASEAVFLPDTPLAAGVVYEARVEAASTAAVWRFQTATSP
jgi:hypothetical protein